MIMRCIGVFLFALWLSGCAAQFMQQKTGVGMPMRLPGVSFVSPNEEGWTIYQSPDSNEVSFSQFWPDQDTNVILVKVIRLDTDLSDREFLSNLQATLDKRGPTPRYEIVAKNYIPQYFKQATCLKYDVVIADHQVNKDIVTTGYGCRHPQEPHLIVVFEVTQRAQSQVLSPRLAELSESFFEQIDFITPAK
jgi:hypothetical protein